MTKYEILTAALDLPEYERKQIVLVLMASMLNQPATDEVVPIFYKEESA